MSRNLTFSIGEFYHLFNRGTEKRVIFLDKYDYIRFQALLYLCNNINSIHMYDYRGSTSVELYDTKIEKTLLNIGAYCLMPNHFHIMAKEKTEAGVSQFMHKLSTAYTMYFNKKYERSGSLFQGRFKAVHLTNDTHTKYLFSYIHLNPAKIIDQKWREKPSNKAKVMEFLENYRLSSLVDYFGKERVEAKILNKNAFPDYFNNGSGTLEELADWLDLPRG